MRATLLLLLPMLASTAAAGQFSFSDQTGWLQVNGVSSGAPMGIADMNGDGRDDLIRLDDTRRLIIEYQGDDNDFSALNYGDLLGQQWGLCIADVDGNGYNDILTGGAYNNLKLLLADDNGAGYSQHLIDFPAIFLQGVNFADIDNDGDSDLFACHDDGLSAPFRNDGAGGFTLDYDLINPVSTVPSDNSGNYGSVWMDYDNDGDLDLYISKCRLGVSDPNDGRRRNLLFRRDEDGAFTDVAEAAGLLPLGQSWAAEFGDIDNDGDLDAFIINHDILSKLYLNNSFGLFTEVTATVGIAPALTAAGPGIQVLFEDFDSDGFLDILFTSTGSNHCLFRNNGDLSFTNLANAFPTNGQRIHSATTGDLNDDGFIDVYAGFGSSYNSPTSTTDRLFINNGNDNNWLKVRLEGFTANPNGIGARLSLYGDWGIQVREVRSGESYGLSRSLTRHFGIGQALQIDSLVVRWPSGTIDRIPSPAANQTLVLQEGANCAGATAFSADLTGLSAAFTDLSTTGPTQWNWDFGDGNTSTQQNPAHTYAAPGAYTVCLQTIGACGVSTLCQPVNATCFPPEADFAVQGAGLNLQFVDQSTGNPTQWSWDFGDGNTSALANPAHTYAEEGDYLVCLQVADDCGSDEFCTTVSVVCAPPPVAFNGNVNGLSASFTDASPPSVFAWSWDFGDGNTAIGPNPQHTYDAPGEYLVCLEGTDVCGVSAFCQTIEATCVPPVAFFGFQSNQLSFSFFEDVAGPVDAWLWTFGDGNTSDLPNPQHTYAVPGVYTTCLTASGLCGSDQYCDTIPVACSPPLVGFSAQSEGLAVTFQDDSGSSVIEWFWDFGDGNTSTKENPQHTYSEPGVYQVCLEVNNLCATNQICLPVTITCATPVADFTSTGDDQIFSFADASLNGPTTWSWDFGDGGTSNEQNPQHFYLFPGAYTVCLEASSTCGSDETCQTIAINCTAPVSDFSFQNDDLTVSFFDDSEGQPDNWFWTFGDGGAATASDPLHTYDTPGDYEVCLTTTNNCGSDQYCETISVLCPAPSAAFTFLSNELSISFLNLSTAGISNWLWLFGDGNSSTVQNPQHTYDLPGAYEVCLQAVNVCGSDEICQTIDISCPPPQPAFSVTTDELTVAFADMSSTDTEQWLWNFGDGAGSMQRQPTHTYAAPGEYTVCLEVSSICGTESYCETVTVSCPPPDPAFTFQADELTLSFSHPAAGEADTWSWDFGDGATADTPAPVHTFAGPGAYTVCLEAAGLCGSAQACQNITVTCAPPQAGFLFSADELSVAFSATVAGPADTFLWDFGNGNTATGAAAEFAFPMPGAYLVCLTVDGVCGSDQYCETITVSCPAPQAGFAVSAEELTISLTDLSTNAPAEWLWTFGDGNTAATQSPEHTYAGPGEYQVCLTTTSICGQTQTCQTVTVSCPAPQAAFTFAADQLQYAFSDASTNEPTQWLWDFGDGAASDAPNPDHTFAAPGIYNVCLEVISVCGTTQSCQTIQVSCDPPTAAFDFAAEELTVSFTDLSTNAPTAWQWDFGDGAGATAAAPQHTYAAPGDYTVCLTVTSICGQTQTCAGITVSCAPPEAAFAVTGDDLLQTFTDLSTGMPEQWLWQFGDGATSEESHPAHIFPAPGAYEVCLQVGSLCGQTQYCETITVTCVPPEAQFSVSAEGLTQTFTDASTGTPTTWLWTFGDGTGSTEQNPAHTYAENGIYQVCLNIEGPCGEDMRCRNILVEVTSAANTSPPTRELLLYPNPAQTEIWVATQGITAPSGRLRIFDSTGRLLAEFPWSALAPESISLLDIRPWPPGLYLVVLETEAGRMAGRFLKEG